MIDKYKLWFSHLYDMNIYTKRLILKRLGTAEGVFRAGSEAIEHLNVTSEAKGRLLSLKRSLDPDTLEEYINLNDIKVLDVWEMNCDSLLKSIENPPFLLYYKGTVPAPDTLWISIIGSRRCSEYGRNTAFRLARDLSSKGVTVVSGMARGLDSQAHKGAIEGGGKTVAIFGNGVDICYPPENRDLYNGIIENGCVMSEYPPKTEVRPWHFPMRNRIISGLCSGTLVVEADERSGTLITVNYALEQGREIFAVPGNITSRFSNGTNMLLREGAHVVRQVEDVLDVFGMYLEKEGGLEEGISENMDPVLAKIYKNIGYDPTSLDDIQLISGMEYRQLQFALTNLELEGKIKKLPGQRYIR